MILDLFTRCVLISLLAFGGGGAALPLIERIAVAETGWVSAQDFATAVAFGYITPGPVLITMTFLGYRMAGLAGAFAATFGIFVMPWALAPPRRTCSGGGCSIRCCATLAGVRRPPWSACSWSQPSI